MVERHIKVNVNLTAQKVSVSKNAGKIATPSRMVIAGPSMTGKSQFILMLMKNREIIYDANFSRIIYCIPRNSMHLHQGYLEEMKKYCSHLEVIEGLPDLTELRILEDKTPKIIFVDDQMDQFLASPKMLDLVCRVSHHTNTSVCYTMQNVFHASKHARSFMRQTSEKVIMFSKTDNLVLSILSRQIFPNNPDFLQKCFEWISLNKGKAPLKYLFIDSSTLSLLPFNAIVRSFIFGQGEEETEPIYFFPKN